MRPRSRIQTTGPNNRYQLRDYSKSSNRSESPDLLISKVGSNVRTQKRSADGRFRELLMDFRGQ